MSRAFYELAVVHGGYFTTHEAAEAGLSYRQLSYHSAAGHIDRVMHGVYRLVNYPEQRHGDMIAVALWAGRGSAISHESALAVYELAAAMPPVIHLTAPSAFSGRRQGVRVHHEDLPAEERRVWDDVPVTTVERTLIDLARSGDPSLVRVAARESFDRGLTTRARLARAIDRLADQVQIRHAIGARLPAAREPA